MNLDQALLILARRLRASVPLDRLTDETRTALLTLWAEKSVSGVPAAEAKAITAWLRDSFADSSDPAGAVYQEALRRVIGLGEAGEIAVRTERQAHRATGAYYTLDAVVRYMVSRAAVYRPSARSVIDPACGSGVFLREARRVLGGEVRLIGLDADATALQLAAANVPGAELLQSDALFGEDHGGPYDLCLGNPPYISSGLRGATGQDRERLAALRQRYPQTAEYKVNTYPLFIERGLELLQEGGVLGFIVPDSFLSGRYFAGIRRLLLSHTLLELTLIREDFWEHGRVGQSVILFVRKGSAASASRHSILVQVCDRVSDLSARNLQEHLPGNLVWGSLQRIRLLADEHERRLVRAMEAVPATPLGQLLATYSGLIGKAGQKSLLHSANPHLSGPWGRLLRSGKEIDRYRLVWSGEEVCLDPALIKSGGRMAYYQQPKLLLRQTADQLRAVYDEDGYYCLNNIHLLVPRESGVDLRAMLGLINSGPVNRYYRALTMETGRLYPQVDLDLLESIPVPALSVSDTEALARLVRARESAAPDRAAPVEHQIDHLVQRLYGLNP
jgi:SAM-dependent methyltransferase